MTDDGSHNDGSHDVDSITASANATTFASRNPGKAVQEARGRKKKEPLSDSQQQERKERQARNTMRAEDLQADIDAFCAQRAATIVALAQKHDKEIDYIRSLLLNESGFKSMRITSLYNAVMHHLKEEGNVGMFFLLALSLPSAHDGSFLQRSLAATTSSMRAWTRTR
jgi:hypothetical protein